MISHLLSSLWLKAMRRPMSWRTKAMQDGADMAQIRASTVQQERMEVYAAFAVCSVF